MKKSRFFYLHKNANQRKIDALDALQVEYTAYMRICVEHLINQHKFFVLMKDRKSFFPSSEILSSQIVKNVQDHAISVVSGWSVAKYTQKLKSYTKTLFKAGLIDEPMKIALFTIGKYGFDTIPEKNHKGITQESINLYWSILLEPSISGKTPTVSSKMGMKLSEMTSVLGKSEDTCITQWWLGFSHLKSGKRRIQLPLNSNPYVNNPGEVSKGISARKEPNGRWRFEVVETKNWKVPSPSSKAGKVSVDVGKNVIAATSTGRLFDTESSKTFDKKYERIQEVKANRQRQGLSGNSPKLQCLEDNLSGFVKTVTGTVANELVKAYPDVIFVVEDLDLRGCKGQKRFTYRALQHALETKAQIEKVNPAYTSQMCPDCGYVSRNNRRGTRFHCRSCGSVRHADVVGAINLLRRSEDKQVDLGDHPSEVKALLRERYLRKRSSSSRVLKDEPSPCGRELTTRVNSKKNTGTASKQVVTSNK